MDQSNLAMAEAYYSAVERGDNDKIGSYLHSDVKYLDPMWPVTGKDRVWPTAKLFSAGVEQLQTAAKFSMDDKVVLYSRCDLQEVRKAPENSRFDDF